jgi:D-alanyl-D-alanine carboxypeptidase/D-alanyl-D-alanine-endopeptidase (penicillin-binding protein 4)
LKKGGAGTFAAGAAAVSAAVSDTGIPGVRLVDGSGLSTQDRVTPAALAALLRRATDRAHPELLSLATGLPVAGFSGTMLRRFRDKGTLAYAGLIHAKTGTLKDVTSLAGTVVDRDGRLLVFAFISNRPRPVAAPASPTKGLDALTAVVAACGCR